MTDRPPPMDRFSATLLVRRTLKRRASRNHAFLVEALMEELARLASEPAESWAVMGLLSQLDREYAETNPLARGRTARQQAETEGVAPEHAASLERWCAPATAAAGQQEGGSETRPRVEDALFLAESLAGMVLARPELAGDAATAPAEIRDLVAALGRELELRRQAGDGVGDRLDTALDRLGSSGPAAARAAVDALQRVAQDLR